MRFHTKKVRGIVIRRANVGEADRIITLVAPDGKIAVVARGVRKPTSRKAGALELFNVVDLELAETRGLPIIKEAALVASFPTLREDFPRAAHAYWAGELVDRLTEEREENSLFEPLYTYLIHLDAAHDPLDIHAFELVALRELGWQPTLSACAQCQAPLAGERLGWSDRLGGVLGSKCCAWPADVRTVSQGGVKVLRLLVERGYDVGDRVRIPSPTVEEVAQILHRYLETLGERRWKSPTLFERIAESE